MVPVRYNLRSLVVRKATSAAALFGVALVVFVIASAMMLVAGIRETLKTAGSPDCAIVVRVGATDELNSQVPVADVNKVLIQPTVRRDGNQPDGVGEIVTVGAMAKTGTNGYSNVQFRGTTEAGMRFRPNLKVVAGVAPRPGVAEAMVGSRLNGRFAGLSLGETFEVAKNRPVKVVGIFEDAGSSYESEVWFDRDIVAAASGREGTVASVRVRLQSVDAFDAFKAAIESDKQLGLEVMRETEFYERQSEGLSLLMGFVGGMIAFFCSIGAMIGATITMYGSIANRQREIGTLRALGFKRGAILASFLVESVVLTLTGSVLGAAASLSMQLVQFSMMNQASWSEVVFRFEPTPEILITAVVLGGLMGIAGGFLPAIRAARISPIAALRNV